jgi:hypothetical protein
VGPVVCFLISLLVWRISPSGLTGRERKLVQWGFIAHVVGTIAIVAFHEYLGGGDMVGYAFYGHNLARLIQLDFTRNFPECIRLVLHMENSLPRLIVYDTQSTFQSLQTEMNATTTMFGLTGLAMFVFGDNLFCAALPFSLYAFVGTAYFFKRLRPALLEHERAPVAMALFFVPSAVFWASGIVKEAVLVGSLGLLCGGLYDFVSNLPGIKVRALPFIAIGAVGAVVVKPYAIFPLALAGGAWLDASRGKSKSVLKRWAIRLVAVGFSVFAIAALSRMFPEFGVERLGESLAGQQGAGDYFRGAGGHIDMGSRQERSLAGQLQFVPLALLNALTRPVIFEARNASMFVASLETLVAVVLLIQLFQRHGLRPLYRRIVERPPFVGAVVFTLSFGVAVGLATTNLGSLSRYRVPMVPLYAAVLLAMRATKKSPAPVVAVRRSRRELIPELLRQGRLTSARRGR